MPFQLVQAKGNPAHLSILCLQSFKVIEGAYKMSDKILNTLLDKLSDTLLNKLLDKSKQKLLQLLSENPRLIRKKLAEEIIGITENAVKKNFLSRKPPVG